MNTSRTVSSKKNVVAPTAVVGVARPAQGTQGTATKGCSSKCVKVTATRAAPLQASQAVGSKGDLSDKCVNKDCPCGPECMCGRNRMCGTA